MIAQATKLRHRALARQASVITMASENAYASSLRTIFRGLHESFVDTLITHRKLRTGFIDTFDVLNTDALGDDPLGWMTLGTAGASIEVHFTAQVPGKVGKAFDAMAPKLVTDTRRISTLMGIQPKDRGVLDAVAAAREANIQLVERAGRKYAADVRAVFEDPANYDLSPAVLRDLLLERGSVSVSQADLIARDQTLKLAGTLNKVRQLNAGVEEYTWSGVMDRRERRSHVDLEGRRFRWGQPTPIGYEPGQDYQCRCIAIAWIAELEGL